MLVKSHNLCNYDLVVIIILFYQFTCMLNVHSIILPVLLDTDDLQGGPFNAFLLMILFTNFGTKPGTGSS